MKALPQTRQLSDARIAVLVIVTGSIISYLLFISPLYALVAGACLVALIAINKNPIIVFCIGFPMLQIFFNYSFARRPIAYLSVFDFFLLVGTLLLVLILLRRGHVETYSVYIPIFVCLLVLFVYVLINHGSSPGAILLLNIEQFWPLLLVTQFLDNSKQLKIIVIVWLLTFGVLSMLYLPALLSSGSNWIMVHSSIRHVVGDPNYQSIAYTGSSIYLVKYVAISPQSMLAMVISLPVFLGVAFAKTRIRYLAYVVISLIIATVLLSTFLAAVVALLVAIWIFVLLFLFRRQSIKKGTAFILGFVFVLLIIGLSQSPLLKTTIERQRALGEDPSTQARLELMHLELKGLAEGNLLIGYGTYEGNITFQGAAPKEGHNSVSTIAFQYGLLFFVPFLLIFGIIFRKNMTNMRREGKSRQDPFLIGISAAFLVALFSLFLDPVLPMPQTASVIWLIAGLILVMNRNADIAL